jgi:hypothetical protein
MAEKPDVHENAALSTDNSSLQVKEKWKTLEAEYKIELESQK